MPRRRIIKKEPMVIGDIMGGLGNQLFIIFTTIAYSLKHNIKYSIRNIERVRKSYFDTPLYQNINVCKENLIGFKRFKEKSYTYEEIPKYDAVILYGYYQSYKYFNQYRDKIIDHLNIYQSREILDYDGFVHFRIGDYKKYECHPICDINYYIKSLEDIYKKNEKELSFIYYFEEEDRNTVEEKVKIFKEKFPRFSFTPVDTNLPDYKQMLSMTTMKYCIMANSSFSWWGVYLNQRSDKVVYYPEKWFTGSLSNYDTSDLIPKNWKIRAKRNAYVLTLDKKSERAMFSKNILDNIGFNVIFFEALKDKSPMVSHRKSMYAIYEKILNEEENDYTCVFEDDINTNLDINIDYIINYEKLSEDIIYLGFSDYKACYIETDKIINGNKLKKVKGGIRCIHSLMLSKKGVEILKKLYDDNPDQLHMDVLLEKYSLDNPLYVINENEISPCHPKHYGIFFQDRRLFNSELHNCKYY